MIPARACNNGLAYFLFDAVYDVDEKHELTMTIESSLQYYSGIELSAHDQLEPPFEFCEMAVPEAYKPMPQMAAPNMNIKKLTTVKEPFRQFLNQFPRLMYSQRIAV